MKFYIALAVVTLATLSTCYPGNCIIGAKRATEDDVELIPSARRYNPFGVIDLEANPGSFDDLDDDFPGIEQGWRDSFSSFLTRINDLVKNVRTQVTKDLEDKLKNGTTTSTVEIINGHRVVKNETVYKDPHSFVKSIVYEVLPNDDDTTGASLPGGKRPEVDTEAPKKHRDREPLEDSDENEVNALNEGGENINIETLADQIAPQENFAYKVGNDNNWSEFIRPDKVEMVDNNEIPRIPVDVNEIKPYDLSSDIRVNEILEQNDYPKNPDAEIFELDVPKLIVT